MKIRNWFRYNLISLASCNWFSTQLIDLPSFTQLWLRFHSKETLVNIVKKLYYSKETFSFPLTSSTASPTIRQREQRGILQWCHHHLLSPLGGCGTCVGLDWPAHMAHGDPGSPSFVPTLPISPKPSARPSHDCKWKWMLSKWTSPDVKTCYVPQGNNTRVFSLVPLKHKGLGQATTTLLKSPQ